MRTRRIKLLDWVRASWLTLTQFDDVLTPRQMQICLRRVYTQKGQCVTGDGPWHFEIL